MNSLPPRNRLADLPGQPLGHAAAGVLSLGQAGRAVVAVDDAYVRVMGALVEGTVTQASLTSCLS